MSAFTALINRTQLLGLLRIPREWLILRHRPFSLNSLCVDFISSFQSFRSPDGEFTCTDASDFVSDTTQNKFYLTALESAPANRICTKTKGQLFRNLSHRREDQSLRLKENKWILQPNLEVPFTSETYGSPFLPLYRITMQTWLCWKPCGAWYVKILR